MCAVNSQFLNFYITQIENLSYIEFVKEFFVGESNVYPKIKGIKNNSYYQGLLQNLYSGGDGEMASFFQLTYQNFILYPFGSEHASTFAQLAEEDLLHAKHLAQAIISLGGDPAFCSTQGVWLSGRVVDYIKGVKQMVGINIEAKEKLVIDYKTTISKIDEIQIKRMLEGILQEEEEHLSKLKSIYRAMQ